jgi:hypothetical protein
VFSDGLSDIFALKRQEAYKIAAKVNNKLLPIPVVTDQYEGMVATLPADTQSIYISQLYSAGWVVFVENKKYSLMQSKNGMMYTSFAKQNKYEWVKAS